MKTGKLITQLNKQRYGKYIRIILMKVDVRSFA